MIEDNKHGKTAGYVSSSGAGSSRTSHQSCSMDWPHYEANWRRFHERWWVGPKLVWLFSAIMASRHHTSEATPAYQVSWLKLYRGR